MHDVPRAHAPVEVRELLCEVVEQEWAVGRGCPLDEDELVRDASSRKVVVIELERTEEPGGKIAAVAVIAAGQDDAEKRRQRIPLDERGLARLRLARRPHCASRWWHACACPAR